MTIPQLIVRELAEADHPEWARMRTALWPDQTTDDMQRWLEQAAATVIVAASPERDGLCGFVEVGERAYAEGCDSMPVGYIEGWWVDPDVRQQGVGASLIRAAESWARGRGPCANGWVGLPGPWHRSFWF